MSSLFSLRDRSEPALLPFLHPRPVPRPPDWIEHVNTPLHAKDLQRLRRSVRRGTPFGPPAWVEATARLLGPEDTLRLPGRPSKATNRHDPASSPPTLFSQKPLRNVPVFSHFFVVSVKYLQ